MNSLKSVYVLMVAYGPANVFSAYSKRITDIANVLADNSYNVTLLWFSPFYKMRAHDQFRALQKKMTIKIIPTLPLFAVREIGLLGRWFCSRIIRYIVNKMRVDIVHAETEICGHMVVNARISKPLVIDFHGDFIAEMKMYNSAKWKIKQAKKYVEVSTKHAMGIITVSDAMRNYLASSYYVKAQSFAIVPCAVDVTSFRIDTTHRIHIRRELGIEDRHVLCYCGGTDVWQCISETLGFLSELRLQNPKIFFLFLTNSTTSKFRGMLKKIGEQEQDYKVIGIDQSQVPDYLSAADVGLLLRKEDPVNKVSSPTKFGEYLAAGLPVITTRSAGDVPSIIEKTSCGFVLDHHIPNANQIIKASKFINDVMANREKISILCRKAAEQERSWGILSKRIVELYDLLLENAN